MSSSNSPTKIQNPKSSNLLETAEVVFLAASAVGLAASLVWGQSVYAQGAIVISLVLNFVNRQKLHRQVKTSTAATFDRVNQQAVTTDRAIEQLQLAVNALDEALAQTSRENLNVGPGENVHSLISAIENLRQRLIILEKTIKMIQSEIETHQPPIQTAAGVATSRNFDNNNSGLTGVYQRTATVGQFAAAAANRTSAKSRQCFGSAI